MASISTCAQGEFFAFLGPNAAGKTTTIKMLAGLLRPTGGARRDRRRGHSGGTRAREEPARLRAGFSVSLRQADLDGVHAVRRRIFTPWTPAIDARRDALFERFHLDDYAHELTENLSHGTRQRLVIASALLHDPRVLIIDEPMVGLDPMHARIVKEEFKARAQSRG